MSKLILLKESPKCPKCKVPMSTANFKHTCGKGCCKSDDFVSTVGHNVYRCPKCYNLYYEK